MIVKQSVMSIRPFRRQTGIVIFALLFCIAGDAWSETEALALAPSSDYSLVAASLGAVAPGSLYRWSVNGRTVAEETVAESFFLSGDGCLETARGESPRSVAGARFIPGRFGQAFIAPAQGLAYTAAGNTDLSEGSIDFWVSPLFDGKDGAYSGDLSLFAYTASNGDSLHIRQVWTGVVCAQAMVGGEYLSAYSDAASMRDWEAGSWHHVAFNFSEKANFMRIYVDGKTAGDTNEGSYRAPSAATVFTLGNPNYAIAAIRIRNEVLSPSRIATEASRGHAPAPAEVSYPLASLAVGDLVELQAGQGRGSFTFRGVPISNITPGSGLLSAGSTSVRLTASSAQPAELRYSVNRDLPFADMARFGTETEATHHEGLIEGLSADPATVSTVYLRASFAPAFTAILMYRSVPALKNDYPRIANLWSWRLSESEYRDYTASLQLAVPACTDPESLRRIREVNPDIVLLGTLQPLEHFDGDEPVPDSYFLKDTKGQRIVLWPGSQRLNITRPEVVAYNVERVKRSILDSGLLLDGAFFDSYSFNVSWTKSDSYGRPIAIDADNDGQADDPASLDAAWKAGMIEIVRRFREEMPGAIISGHLGGGVEEYGEYFEGNNIGFACVNTIEGRMGFSELLGSYLGWGKGNSEPHISIIDAGAPNRLGYGYGVYSSFQEAERLIPAGVLSFTRDWYPTMRFGLCTALMGNGLFERHFSDVLYCEEWSYDEFGFNIGSPLGPAVNVYAAQSQASLSVIPREGFTPPLAAPWGFWADEAARTTVSFPASGIASSNAVKIDVEALPPGSPAHCINLFRDSVSVAKDEPYIVRFRAKADKPRYLVVSLQRRAGEWEGLGLWTRLPLDSDWTDYELPFNATGTRSDGGLQFLLGEEKGAVYIDAVSMEHQAPNLYRRDFERGVVLLNGTKEPKTVKLEAGLSRFMGNQAPLRQYILDDGSAEPLFTGYWKTARYETYEWQVDGPFHNAWDGSCHETDQADAAVEYRLNIPQDGVYTISAWLCDAPNRDKRALSATYEIHARGELVAKAKLDQRVGADAWNKLVTVKLAARDAPVLRLSGAESGLLYADALLVESEARYNDGSPCKEVTLDPYDGIILRRDGVSDQ